MKRRRSRRAGGRKSFYMMSSVEKRTERMRRVELLVKAFRDIDFSERRAMTAAALIILGASGAAKQEMS